MKRMIGYGTATVLTMGMGACGGMSDGQLEEPSESVAASISHKPDATRTCNPSHNHKLCPAEGDPHWCDCIPRK